ncbi:MAG TPA: 4a-hydroxytetrahydrobiopterin dehydratase [Acidimicrobiaceae bacterium]|nr:4a-hydroxytetrahydrobiopterin dehydratase [Acidimicrobiaceae bacterium]
MSPRDRVLTPEEVADRFATIPEWAMVDGHLHREFTYANFAEAWAFMNRVAPIAEELDHHPNWSNVWNSVVIDITSHDSGGPTERCFALAKRIDGVAKG